MSVASRQWDLSWCHGRDVSTAGGGEMVEVWRLQFGDLEIFILLYKTPKRRRFDVVFF